MKKVMNKINFALIGLMASVPAFAAPGAGNDMCNALKSLSGVFNLLRTMAFIGAAFVLMDIAWTWIKKPEDVDKGKIKDIGVGLIAGFFLLFGVGFVLQFVGSKAGAEYFGCVVKALG